MKLGNELEEMVKSQARWKKYGSKWIGIALSTCPQTLLGVSGIGQEMVWDRTTFTKEHGKWKLVEMAMPLNLMMEQEEKIEGLRERALVLTTLSAGERGPEDLGFEVLEPLRQREQSREGFQNSEFQLQSAKRNMHRRRLNVNKRMRKTLRFRWVDWRWEVQTLIRRGEWHHFDKGWPTS